MRRFANLFFLVILLVGVWVFFVPRKYDVPAFVPRAGTAYWELSTGSRIGFFKVEGAVENARSPIIYLHGGPGGMIKDEIIDALRPLAGFGHDLYFYDQIGSGHSARLDDIEAYTVERHKADLREIIEYLQAEKVILIAHSWGCLLAINYLQDYPDKVERLILEGPGPILPVNRKLAGEEPPENLNLISPESTNEEGNQQVSNLRSKLIVKWSRIFKSKLASDREVDDFFTCLNAALNKSTFCKVSQAEVQYRSGGGYYAHLMTVQSFSDVPDKRDQMDRINMPVLVIRGQCDNQKWGYAKEYLDLLPNAQLAIMDNVGHDLVNGDKEAYFNLVSDFLLMPTDTADWDIR